jgi:hypothetical protein
MISKRIIILTLIGFIIVTIAIGIVLSNLGKPEENYVEADASVEKQLEHLHNMQIKADTIVMKDDKVQELIEGNNYIKTFEVIHNESYLKAYYWIGFEYTNLSVYKGFMMTGGNIYQFNVDLDNETVLSIEKSKNQRHLIKQTTDESYSNREYTSIYSLESIRTGNVWNFMRHKWEHDFGVNGTGKVTLLPNSPSKVKGWGCFKHHLTLSEIYNKENFLFDYCENCLDHKIVWCSGEKLPHIKSEHSGDKGLTCIASYPPENSVWNIINPGNWPSDAGFSYHWRVIMKQNQTIVFDMNLHFINIENARNTEKTNHNWRVIITSTPDPEKLSVEQMKEYGISGFEATHYISYDGNTYSDMTCSYFHNSGVILAKQEFISAIADEK